MESANGWEAFLFSVSCVGELHSVFRNATACNGCNSLANGASFPLAKNRFDDLVRFQGLPFSHSHDRPELRMSKSNTIGNIPDF